MPKKILAVIKIPPPVTGATLMNKRLSESNFLNDQFDFHFVRVSYTKDVRDIGTRPLYKSFKFTGYLLRVLFRILFRRPDLFYIQLSPTGLAFVRDSMLILIVKLFAVKHVFHLRSRGIKEKIRNPLLSKYYRFIFRKASVICLSEFLTSDIQKVFHGKTYIVHNGMPVYKIFEARLTPPSQPLQVLFLSNLFKSKGVLDYLMALKIIHVQGIPFKGVIIGAEADVSKEELLRQIKNLGLSGNVDYYGPVYNEEKLKQLQNADVFVFPTYYEAEAFPGVILEAMQFELPVISTHECSVPVMIDDGITGFMVESRNPDQIAEKLNLLLTDPEKTWMMGKKAREKYLANFTFHHFEQRLTKVLHEILGD